jgi:hypothetical protein
VDLGVEPLNGKEKNTHGAVSAFGSLRDFEDHPGRIEGDPDAARERNSSTSSTL